MTPATIVQLYRGRFSSNMTGATSGAETAYHSGTPEFTHGFSWGSCYPNFSCRCNDS